MAEMFEVQQGVPLPEIDRAPKRARRKYPIEGMAVGQFFLVPRRACKSVSAYISRISKNVPGKFSARRCWMRQQGRPWKWRLCGASDKGAVEGTGVWRTE